MLTQICYFCVYETHVPAGKVLHMFVWAHFQKTQRDGAFKVISAYWTKMNYDKESWIKRMDGGAVFIEILGPLQLLPLAKHCRYGSCNNWQGSAI